MHEVWSVKYEIWFAKHEILMWSMKCKVRNVRYEHWGFLKPELPMKG